MQITSGGILQEKRSYVYTLHCALLNVCTSIQCLNVILTFLCVYEEESKFVKNFIS